MATPMNGPAFRATYERLNLTQPQVGKLLGRSKYQVSRYANTATPLNPDVSNAMRALELLHDSAPDAFAGFIAEVCPHA